MDWGTEKQERYRTRDVCEILGIAPDALRGKIDSEQYPLPSKDMAGRMFWTEEETERSAN